MCVGGHKAVLDREALAETQVDLGRGKGPGENQLMLSENGDGNDRALDLGKEWI